MVEIRDLKRYYRMNADTVVHALDGLNFEAQNQEIVAVVGTSGSGKSTLLNVLGGLDREYDGEVIVDGKDVRRYNPNTYRRKKVGTVFQQFNLISALNVVENVMLPATFGHQFSKKEAKKRSEYLLDRVGLSDRKRHRPTELSGGQMQRVAIARAVLSKPEILLADEPTGNLDTKTGQEIMNLLYELNQEEGMTLFIVTHDSELVKDIDKKVYLQDGKIIDIKG